MPGHVFVSYSHGDSEYVRALVAFLRGHGHDVWLDEGIDVGSQWIAVIRGQVDTCAAFVPVMTPAADGSTWVARELERADAFNRPILPLLLEGQPLGSIAGVQFEDVRGGRMPSQRFLDRLASVVAAHTAPTVHGDQAPSAPTSFTVVLEALGDRKISVIKVVRELTHLSLADAKALVESTPHAVLTTASRDRGRAGRRRPRRPRRHRQHPLTAAARTIADVIDSHATLTEILTRIDDLSGVQWDTVRALASSGDRSLVPRVQRALESYLDEDNHYGRDVMCSLLAGIVGVRAFPLVLRAFARPTRDDNDSLMGMLRGLIRSDREACRSVILTFALERHRDLRIAGLRALGHAIAPADYDLLEAAANDPDPDVRRAALGSMSSLKGDPRVLATLVVALSDSDPLDASFSNASHRVHRRTGSSAEHSHPRRRSFADCSAITRLGDRIRGATV